VLVELANKTIAAAAQVGTASGLRSMIRNRSGSTDATAANQISMLVCGFNSSSVNDKTEKQKGQHTSKPSVRSNYLWVWSSVHVLSTALES
jgi:hypothetical protein